MNGTDRTSDSTVNNSLLASEVIVRGKSELQNGCVLRMSIQKRAGHNPSGRKKMCLATP